MEFATGKDLPEIMKLYKEVIVAVNKTDIKLGWNIESYPNEVFVKKAIDENQMCILKKEERIIGAAVVNHTVNKEYDDINWRVSGPRERIATIHALAVSPECRGKAASDIFLSDIENHCRKQKDMAIHLDVIDTNIPAYKLYLRNGYEEIACIKMYYEVVGTREFWMMERVL